MTASSPLADDASPTGPHAAADSRRVLMVRLSAIGDIVHTLPVAAALAAADFEVLWAVQPGGRSLLEENPAVTSTVVLPARNASRPGALLRALSDLRSRRVGIALDLQGLWKSALWARASGAGRRIGWTGAARREPASALLLNELRTPPDGTEHVLDKNLALLLALGLDVRGERRFPLPSLDRQAVAVDRELAALGVERPVLLHPGGGWASKLWSAERYGELAAMLARRGLPVLVSWGPGEKELAARVVAASQGAAIACFPASLLEFAALAQRSRAIVAADTGPLHLACAVGTPAVALFGPTDPRRNGPWSPEDRVVARRPTCFPCHRRECPVHRGVLDAIPADEVEQALLQRIGLAAS